MLISNIYNLLLNYNFFALEKLYLLATLKKFLRTVYLIKYKQNLKLNQ